MSFYLYEILCSVSNKYYIGWTTDPEERWRNHRRLAERGKGSAVHAAIRKYGVNNFRFKILRVFRNRIKVLRAEIQEIRRRGTHQPFGYNIALGGEGGCILGMSQSAIARATRRRLRTIRIQKIPMGGAVMSLEARKAASRKRKITMRKRGISWSGIRSPQKLKEWGSKIHAKMRREGTRFGFAAISKKRLKIILNKSRLARRKRG